MVDLSVRGAVFRRSSLLVVGEGINASRKGITKALESQDREFIQREAKAQNMAGADYIDLNAATLGGKEVDYREWLIECVEAVTDKPLWTDSPNPFAIKAVISERAAKPMINSITLEASRLERMLPLAGQYKTKVIALCQSDSLIARAVEEKLDMAKRLVKEAREVGVPLDDLYIDPLIHWFFLCRPIANPVLALLRPLRR